MKNAILICDYFTYFDEDKASKGFYISNYWKKLLPLIKKKKINLNFLHLALDEKKYNLKNKIKVLDKFNVASRMSHNILDSYIDFTILAKVTYEWFLNCFKYFYLKIMHNNNYIFQNYLLKKMFVDSFIGVWSIKNLYFFYLFEKFFKETQQNNKVITYVSEFQSWEKLIFFNSNKQQSKNIFALQFNPIRNWDLRYQFEISKDNINLYPKKIITFYNSSKKNLIKAFSKSKKIKVFLSDNLRPLDYSFKKKFKKKKILIVGDHDDSSTLNLLKIVNKLLEQKSKYLFEYKPHPISKIKISNFDNLQKLKVYWDNKCFEYMYDAFIVSNKTSLGLELSNKGFKTGVILDSKSLNLSPLDKNYQFLIKNEIELNNFINVKKSHNSAIKIRNIISWNNIVNKWLKIIKYE